MRVSWRLGLAVVGIASTFTFAASARFLKPASDEGSVLAPVSPPPASIASGEAFVITDVSSQPPRHAHARRPVDAEDPWAPSQKTFVTTQTPKHAQRMIDTADPWARSPTAHLDTSDPWSTAPGARAATPPSLPSRLSDGALRDAIKHAIDGGDLDRAAKLLEILRAPR